MSVGLSEVWEIIAFISHLLARSEQFPPRPILYKAGEEYSRYVITKTTGRTRIGSREALDALAYAFQEMKLGRLEVVSFDPGGAATVRVRENTIANFHRRLFGRSEQPICVFISGMVGGALALGLNQEVECEEVECIAMDAEACLFDAYTTASVTSVVSNPRPLTPLDLMGMPDDLREAALIVLRVGSATADEVAMCARLSTDDAWHALDRLVDLGFLKKIVRKHGPPLYVLAVPRSTP